MGELTELPPPSKGAGAGFYPDPLGGGRARWWDGYQWTTNVGPVVEPGAPGHLPLPPPTRTCPRCAARSQTFAANCPNCGRSFTRASPWKIAAIALAAGVLTLGGCGACVLVGLNEAELELDEGLRELDEAGRELDQAAITEAEYDSLTLGMTQAPVEQRLGEPFERVREDGIECLVYDEEGGGIFGAFYVLCFEDGRLVSKDVD